MHCTVYTVRALSTAITALDLWIIRSTKGSVSQYECSHPYMEERGMQYMLANRRQKTGVKLVGEKQDRGVFYDTANHCPSWFWYECELESISITDNQQETFLCKPKYHQEGIISHSEQQKEAFEACS